MRTNKKHVILGATLLLCLASVFLGWLVCSPWTAAAGGLGLCYLALRVAYLGREEKEAAQ